MGPQSCAALIRGLGLALAIPLGPLGLLGACGPSQPGGHGNLVDGGPGDPDAGMVNQHTPDGDPTVDECMTLHLTIRDFSPTTHPDFEPDFTPDEGQPGLVKAKLGADHTPDYAPAGPTDHTAGPTYFAQWYHDTPDINQRFEVALPLTQGTGNTLVYDSTAFFPIDGKGYGDEGNPHNFHFTTEVHTTFEYQGGEKFTFRGDDDMWLFINEQLAIDLGGLHPEEIGSVDLDAQAAALGIKKGNRYRMDIFHAERHTDSSNFHVETTISCFVVP